MFCASEGLMGQMNVFLGDWGVFLWKKLEGLKRDLRVA